jgi:hypothetical protein
MFSHVRTSHAWAWKVAGGILALGLLLRVATMVLYTPTVFNYYGGDSTRYMRLEFTGVSGIFGDNAMPAGYPAFLALLREINAWLPLTTMVQHLLGLGAAALLYAAVVRAGAPRWAALLPLAVVALSGDQIFIEHGILTEALWMPVLALGMYALARSITTASPGWWLIAGGAVLACSALVRHVSLVLPLVLAIWAVIALPGRPRLRVAHGAAILVSATLVIGMYFVVSKPVAGGYSGLVENQGLSLYGRVGQFADCDKFTPPTGSAPLCADTPPDQRPGPFFWTFGEQSPIRTALQVDGYNADHQELLAQFGRAAILNQPWDYLRTASHDFARYFVPDIGTPRPDNGSDAERMSFASTIPTAQGVSLEQLANQFDDAYSGVGNGRAGETARTLLGDYQSIFRVQGPLTLILIALAAMGAVAGRGRLRAGASLFLVAGVTLLALPPLLSSYDVRYSVPPINLLAAGAAFGLAVIAERLAARKASPDRVHHGGEIVAQR